MLQGTYKPFNNNLLAGISGRVRCARKRLYCCAANTNGPFRKRVASGPLFFTFFQISARPYRRCRRWCAQNASTGHPS